MIELSRVFLVSVIRKWPGVIPSEALIVCGKKYEFY